MKSLLPDSFLRTVVQTGVSPMNPKVKWSALDCGHEVFGPRKKPIGAVIKCEKCARMKPNETRREGE